MATETWNGSSADWYANSANWTPAGLPGSSDDVVIDSGQVDLASGDAGISIASLSLGGGILSIADPGAVQTVSGNVSTANGAELNVDESGTGGSTLAIGGALAVNSFEGLTIGNAAMTAASTVTVAGTLDVTNGGLVLAGGSASGATASLIVATVAPATFTGDYDLEGDAGGAILQWASGGITAIGSGSGYTSVLSITGANAFAEIAGQTGSNSALSGLATIASNGELNLSDGASVATDSALSVASGGDIDLTGGGSGPVTSLSVGGAAPSTLVGSYYVDGGTAGATLQWTSGGITAIGDGSGNFGELTLDGANAFAEIAGQTGSNSALSGLTTIALNGTLQLSDGASVATDGALSVAGDLSLEGSSTAGPVTTLSVGGAAPSTLVGTYNLTSGAGGAVLEYASGGITAIGGSGGIGTLDIDGPNAFVADAAAPGSNSALSGLTTITSSSSLDLSDGANLATTGALTVAAGGDLDLSGSGAAGPATTLSIGAAAPTMLAGYDTITGNLGGAVLEYANGSITAIGDGGSNYGTLTIDGANAFVADAAAPGSDGALSGLTTIASGSMLELEDGASLATTGALTVGSYGTLELMGSDSAGPATTLAEGAPAPATLTGNNEIVGNASGAALEWTGGAISQIGDGSSNAGELSIDGANAFAEVAGQTGSNSALSGLTAIASNGSLDLSDGADLTTSGSLTIASGGSLDLGNADYGSDEGGTTLAIDGNLGGTVASAGSAPSFGDLEIGNEYGTAASNTVSVAGTLDATGGTVEIEGGTATGATSSLVVGAAAPATLTGTYELNGGTAGASVSWGSGGIAAIGDGSSNAGELVIDGANAFAEIGATNSNSALSGLATIAANGTLELGDGAAVATSGPLAVTGEVELNGSGTSESGGGAPSIVAAALPAADPAPADPASSGPTTLAIGGAAPSTLTGSYRLTGNASGAVLEWTSGGIAAIGDGASNSGYLAIDGSNAFAEIGATNSNSALTGLATIAANGSLELADGAAVTTSGPLTIAAGGVLGLDTNSIGVSEGGTTLSIGGDLVDSSGSYEGLTIGNPYSMSGPDTLSVAGSLDATGGAVRLEGGNAPGATASLDVAGAASPTLTGTYNLAGIDGGAVLSWGSGGITQIGDGATNAGSLTLDGTNAAAEIAGETGNTSALAGLTTIASNGSFELADGAAFTTGGDLTIAEGGSLGLDNGSNPATFITYAGGGTLTVTGDLIDGSSAGVTIGNQYITTPSVLAVSGALDATGGTVTLAGGETAGASAEVTVGTAAPSTLTGMYSLTANTGGATITWQSGGVTQIGDGASNAGSVTLDGAGASFGTAGASAPNSALTDLTTIASNGTLALGDQATLTTSGALAISAGGALGLDESYSEQGGSTLSAGGGLTSAGTITIGNENMGTAAANATSLLVAGSFSNTGAVSLTGEFSATAPDAFLTVAGAASNAGSVDIGAGGSFGVTGSAGYTQTAGTTTVAGALTAATINAAGGLIDFQNALTSASGDGTFAIGGSGVLEFGSAVDASHTVSFTSASGTLSLGAPASFAPTIEDFAVGDKIDLQNTAVTNLSYANGVLTAEDGTTTVAALTLPGTFSSAGFISAADGSGGTNIELAGNPAVATIEKTGGAGTLTETGPDAYTLDFGTITFGTGAPTAALEVLNSAAAPAASLSGSFTIAANAAFTNAGFDAFSNIAAGAANTAPSVSLATTASGTFDETITLTPASVTASGATALADETLTIEGTIGPASGPPAITAPNAATVGVGRSGAIGGVSVTESPTTSGETFAVSLTDTDGLLSAAGTGVAGAGTTALSITGSLSQVNADLATLTNTDATAGSDTVAIQASDSNGGAAAPASIAVTVNGLPAIAAPASASVGQNAASPISGVSLSESGNTDGETFTVDLSDQSGLLSAIGTGVTGAGTTALSVTGSLGQVNADLATLTDTDASTAADAIHVGASDSFGNVAAGQSIAVSVSPALAPPAVTAPIEEYVGNDLETPIDGISITPSAGLPADTEITLSLSAAGGTLDFWQASNTGTPIITSVPASITGTAAELNTELSELVYTGGQSSLTVSATEEGMTASKSVLLDLPGPTEVGSEPYAQPISILLENSNDDVSVGGTAPNSATAALLQWDQNNEAYVGTVYANLPNGSDAEIGFAAMNDINAPINLGIDASASEQPSAPLVGNWTSSFTNVSIPSPNVTIDPIATVTDSGVQQNDTITLTFTSAPSSDGVPIAGLPDRRVTVVFNPPATGIDDDVDGPDDDDGDHGGDGGGDKGHDFGDVHLTTFDGLYYNFQAAGEFVLAKSTQPGDLFDVQVRTAPWSNSAAVSVTTEAAVGVGTDRVTFDVNRTDTVWIDGSATPVAGLAPGGAAITLGGGAASLKQLTPTAWQVTYGTGETVTVTNYGSFLGVDTTLPRGAPADSVEGLLGNANGNSANDFTLPNGAVLPQPLSYSDLYTTWANAWRVTQPTSLLDYGPGETTATFTDANFPADAVGLSDLPSTVTATAMGAATGAGITNPAAAAGAALDYALTGDPAFLTADNAGGAAATLLPDPTPPAPVTGVGVAAATSTVTESASGATDVDFDVYRVGSDTSAPITVDYSVLAPNAQFLGASSFAGDTLPSGTVTIAAGATDATLALAVTGALGTMPSSQLEVGISTAAGGPSVLASTAVTTVLNDQSVAGTPALPQFLDPLDVGTLTQSGANWTLALGTLATDPNGPPLVIDVANGAAAPANTLFGNLSASGTGVSFQTGLAPIASLVPGQVLALSANLATTAVGSIDETLTFDANERNASGYSAAMTPITLTITGAVQAAAAATLNTPGPFAFGNVHEGASASAALSVTNSASAPAANLDAFFGTVPAGLAASGTVANLAPGATDSTDLAVGLDTGVAGAQSGTIPLLFASSSGNGGKVPLPRADIMVSGAVYRLAAPLITRPDAIVHVGDPGSLALGIANADPADGFSENLLASLSGSSGAITVSGGPSGEIVAGATDSTSFNESFSTAAATVLTGSATFALTSDGGTGAGSIDGLGATALAPFTTPLSVTVDNYAAPAFEELSGPGTLTHSGDAWTLNLGAIAENSGALSVGLGVLNAASGPADDLSGTLSAAGSAGFTASGLAAFSGLAAGQANTAPVATLSTDTAGTETETITLTPTGSNASGYSAALPAETLTITADVENLPAPTITVPSTQTVFENTPAVLGPISITDPNTTEGSMTVVVSDAVGTLAAVASGAGSVAGNGTDSLTLTGDLAQVNAELASLTYDGSAVGNDTVSIAATDAAHASSSASIAVTTDVAPMTAPVLSSPGLAVVVPGQQSGVGGLSISDPYAAATGEQVTLHVESGSVPQTFVVSGGPGGTVTGNGTGDVTITGTLAQVNSYLADGLTEEILSDAYQKAKVDAQKAGELYGQYLSLITTINPLLSEGFDIANEPIEALNSAGVQTPEPLGQMLLEVDVGAYSFAANVLNDVVALASGATSLPPALPSSLGGGGGAHLVTFDGLSYQLDAAGDFLLAGSTSPSNSFTVDARLEPLTGSASASAITEVAAGVGTDRVTIDVGRAAPVWVDGAAVAPVVGTPIMLNGGQLNELSSSTYQITWNTGEELTVTDQGTYLNTKIGLGANDAPGSLAGLLGPDNGQANDFTLPDGTVLPQPLSATDLADFADSWMLPQAASLLDYAPGQTVASFDHPDFPTAPVTLADLPSNVVAEAAAAVTAAGITDPGAVAAAEFDYLATGGDPNTITADQALFQSVTSTVAPVTESGPAPAVLGVIPDQSEVPEATNGETPVTFEVYLTAPETSATTVDYGVAAPKAGDLGASAFGGTLPSGAITLAAGAMSGTFTVDVPEGALGTASSGTVAVDINSASGVPVFAQNAEASVVTPEPGPAPAPELLYLGEFGNFVQFHNNYTLDLGPVQYGQALPTLQFGIENGAAAPADQLAGTIDVAPVEGFTVSGATLPGPLAAGQSYTGITATINTIKFGQNVETITFNPVDTNASGYSAPMSAPLTLTIADTLRFPGMTYSTAWGDVHITTYNGLVDNFQGAGEYWLARSSIPGDNFGIQLRLQPWFTGASVSVITQVALSIGSDRVTFGLNRSDFTWVDGTPSAISTADPVLNLPGGGGTVTELSPSMFRVSWKTGEIATITNDGNFLAVVDGIPPGDLAGGIAGLQGEAEGQANDFQLPDGTVLPQPLTTNELYNVYGNAWRVSQADSDFDYGPGQSTATFTDTSFPTNAVTLSDLPANVVANAASVVAAAGITNPAIAEAAELDYLSTGDPSFVSGAANIQQQVGATGATTAAVTPSAPAPILVGVAADQPGVVESASGTTPVTFDVYLTAADTAAVPVDYAVIAPNPGDLGAAAFGGTAPSGSVTIAAGDTEGQFTIDVPNSAIGTAPNADLEVSISAPDGQSIFAPTASSVIANDQPEPGTPAAPALAYLGTDGTLTENGNAYTFNVATVQGQALAPLTFALSNAAAAPADDLFGTFAPPTGTGFTVTGTNLPAPLAPGASYNGLTFTLGASSGVNSETIVFHAEDQNASGYSAALSDITLTVNDDVAVPAEAALNTPATIIFPNVHVGATDSQGVSVTNTAVAPAANLDVTPYARGSATASGSISELAPGATDHTSITVGIKTSAAGSESGTVNLGPLSDAGNGNTSALSPIAIDLYGNVYREAAFTVTPSGLTARLGASGTASLTITNTDPNDGFSENLIAKVIGTTGSVTASGATGDIAAQSTGAIPIDFSTAAAGNAGTVTLDLESDGTGIDGLGVTDLGDVTIPVSVTAGNLPAQATIEKVSGAGTFAQSGSSYTLDLGTISGATTVALGVVNSAVAPADTLGGSFTIVGANAFSNSGFDAFSGIAPGGTNDAPRVLLNATTPGTYSETIELDPIDEASGGNVPLSPETLTIDGTVVAPPVLSAPSSITVLNGKASPVASVDLSSDTAVASFLAGTATSIDGVSLSDQNGVGADGIFTVSLSDTSGLLSANASAAGGGGTISGSGTTALSIAGTLSEVNADLSTLTDTDASLAPDTITVNASDNAGGSAAAQSILVGHTFILPKAKTTVTGGAGNDLIVANPGTIVPGDVIDGAGGANTLALMGPGFFNLRAATGLGDIQTIDVEEGQAAYRGAAGTFAMQNQIVLLANGFAGTVNVAPDAAFNGANPNPATITIDGANDSATINLGSGKDLVYAGSNNETIDLGTGPDTIFVSQSTIGATMSGGSGHATLEATGGGAMTMGPNIAGVANVLLGAAGTPYDFTANALSGLTINDQSAGTDRIVAGGANQTLTGGAAGKLTMAGADAGSDTFENTSALFNGDTIENFASPGDAIDLTDLTASGSVVKSFTENAAGTAGVLDLSDGTHSASLTLFGQFQASGFTAEPGTGGAGTIITYHQPETHAALAAPVG